MRVFFLPPMFIYDKHRAVRKNRAANFSVVVFLESIPDLVQLQCQSGFSFASGSVPLSY